MRYIFALIVTCRWGDFSNFSHVDKDGNEFTIAFWFPVWLASMFLFLLQKCNFIFCRFQVGYFQEGFHCKGSEFVFHEYGIGMDIARNNGISFAIWDGPHDIHATLKAQSKPGFTYLIASCQVGKNLINKVRKYLINCNNGIPGGLKHQLNKMQK